MFGGIKKLEFHVESRSQCTRDASDVIGVSVKMLFVQNNSKIL